MLAAAVAAAAVIAMLGVAAAYAAPAQEGAASVRATVVGVRDAATLRVRLPHGAVVTLTLLGVRPPGAASCYAWSAAAEMRSLVLGTQVRLSGDDGRALRRAATMAAYVTLAGNRDLGRAALLRGLVALRARPGRLALLASYRRAQQKARAQRAGLWSCSTAPAPPVPAPPAPPAPPQPPSPPAQDRVTADLIRRGFGGGIVRAQVRAWSGPNGEAPDGTFWQMVENGDVQVEYRGRVTCLTVRGNRATIAGIVEETTQPSAPIGSAVTMIFTDRATPGAGQDTTLTFVQAPDPAACPIGSPLEGAEEILIEDGDVVVEDK